MTRLLSLVFFIVSSVTGQAQIVESRVEKYIAIKSIDTFLVYSFDCSGDFIPFPFDSCRLAEPRFLIWKQKGNYYLKKFERCNSYKPMSLDAINPLTYYLQNKADIDTEEIQLPTYIEVKKRRNRVDSLITTSSVSHSCYHKFQLLSTKEPEYKYASTYNLDFKAFDDGKENIYYNYNQKTKFKNLIDLTAMLIKELDDGKRFEPE